MGSAGRRFGYDVKKQTPVTPSNTPMPRMDSLPVYTRDTGELMYYAPISTVPRLIESGLALGLGTRNRTRALVATCGIEELRACRPPRVQPDTHNRETPDNPRGVWTFRKLHAA